MLDCGPAEVTASGDAANATAFDAGDVHLDSAQPRLGQSAGKRRCGPIVAVAARPGALHSEGGRERVRNAAGVAPVAPSMERLTATAAEPTPKRLRGAAAPQHRPRPRPRPKQAAYHDLLSHLGMPRRTSAQMKTEHF